MFYKQVAMGLSSSVDSLEVLEQKNVLLKAYCEELEQISNKYNKLLNECYDKHYNLRDQNHKENNPYRLHYSDYQDWDNFQSEQDRMFARRDEVDQELCTQCYVNYKLLFDEYQQNHTALFAQSPLKEKLEEENNWYKQYNTKVEELLALYEQAAIADNFHERMILLLKRISVFSRIVEHHLSSVRYYFFESQKQEAIQQIRNRK
ncbi:MAG: hypothetical protein LBK68_08035 [Candidatus Margulisbacteria bacterium]|jgi:hypothetical protein|nr:hypothetical protein [Candidatus Margulisiibacteriota bacterium]